MPTNEEGEFELVLGNKQLLSVFFIVVLLLGVFFTMGYIVGRNTMPNETPLASGGETPVAGEAPAFSPPPASEPLNERPSPSGAAPTPAAGAPEPPVQTASPLDPKKSEPAKPEPPPPAKVQPPAAAAESGGTYLQVAATRKAEAELLAEVLSKKGYSTIVMPVPDSALVRVLVGPLSSDALPKTREALQAAGFKPFPRGKL